MKAGISISQVYYNVSVLNFFFRIQSEKTFNDLFDNVEESTEEVFLCIENYTDDLDEFEEMCYNESIYDIINELGLTDITE